ncbi:glycosyl hydrolase [Thiospirochaeta perfilievii]|uniref:Glycosyl hydrolase n=1 Tax=Thiospirochaeta perfilievii TaxID=252967 RepID=A0A5C1QD56_9SPIO|nr:glycoside hydrolase family 3 C-terminal domain-containing protein [Thiospirochaeta perfilievii]QEN05278.1 glycosyl hydrolase [Thiospirochaeta perfilievii]
MGKLKYIELIDKMTLEEKASLMSGKDYWQSQDIEHLGIFSMFLADGPHGIRKQAVSSQQMGLNRGIPATCYPTEATVANSWNEDLGEWVGSYLGKEAVSQKVNVLLGPGLNMKRNPLCGRNFEYFSEDPFLAGKLAAAYVRGIQSQGISACVKHFCAKNQEERSMSIDTIIDERALREIYLTAFEIAVKEGSTKALMSSYNKLNGTYTNENTHIMLDILRGEWDYSGCVITDWGGSNDRVKGLIAGNELEMPSNNGETDRIIVNAVKSGELDEAILDSCVDRLLDLTFTTEKIFDKGHVSFDIEKHHRISQKMAEESIVLLKNDEGILPINFDKKVAVIGDFARDARYQGSGSSRVNPTILDSTLECFDESGIRSVGYAPGFKRYGQCSKKLMKEACDLATKANVVLLYLGLDEATETQGLDRTSMSLPRNQVDLLEQLYSVNKNIVVILSSGAAIEMPWIGMAKGLLHGYLGGQAGARAILRVISGDVNPSGKLAETYPINYIDVPSSTNFPGKEVSVEYRESLFIGYRYFDTNNIDVLFPFGFGLSYTTFEYSNLRVEEDCVLFDVTNSGAYPGMEICQLYIGCESKLIFRPKKELKGFKKIFINPGDTKRVRIPFDDKTFRYFNIKTDSWEIESSNYNVFIGASISDIRLTGSLYVLGTDAPLPYNSVDLPSYFNGRVGNVSSSEFEKLLGYKPPESKWDRKKDLEYNDTLSQCRYARSLLARFAYWCIVFTHWFLKKISRRNEANLIMMSVYNMPFRGIARMTGGSISMGMLDGILLIVNGHFFKGINKFLKERKKNR